MSKGSEKLLVPYLSLFLGEGIPREATLELSLGRPVEKHRMG